jgi:putative aminopeptidase FrvX
MGENMNYMNKEMNLKMISELSNAKGVSGFEDRAVEVIRKFSDGLGDIKEDTLRNLYIYRKGNTGSRPVIQLDAHSDEVGFMVQSVRPNGTLQIIPLGSWVTYNIPAHKVWVRNSEGEYIPGIVGSKPPHYMSEAEKKSPLEISQLTVDIGARSQQEAVSDFKIRIGEPIVPCVEFEYDDEHDIMMGKAFDNRIGCAGVIAALRALEGEELKVDIVAGIASQEEVGARGAVVTSRVIKPDVAIVFEGCPADDTFISSYEVQTGIKKGPMLRHIDARMITNPRFQRFALDLAAKKELEVQEAVRTGGSTNGGSIHISNEGIPTIVIGVPVRYAHTHYGISTYFDYDYSVRLACELLKELDEEIIKSF